MIKSHVLYRLSYGLSRRWGLSGSPGDGKVLKALRVA